jgi:cell wall assembly regulator SMI1
LPAGSAGAARSRVHDAAMTVAALDLAWTRIEAWLAAHAPPLAANLAPPAREAAIAACERQLGLRFPADLRASLARRGAESDEGCAPLIGNWMLLHLDGIAAEHRIMRDLVAQGVLDARTARSAGTARASRTRRSSRSRSRARTCTRRRSPRRRSPPRRPGVASSPRRRRGRRTRRSARRGR